MQCEWRKFVEAFIDPCNCSLLSCNYNNYSSTDSFMYSNCSFGLGFKSVNLLAVKEAES